MSSGLNAPARDDQIVSFAERALLAAAIGETRGRRRECGKSASTKRRMKSFSAIGRAASYRSLEAPAEGRRDRNVDELHRARWSAICRDHGRRPWRARHPLWRRDDRLRASAAQLPLNRIYGARLWIWDRTEKVIVSGGSRGIGRAIVECFLAKRAEVAFCARSADGVVRAQEEPGERTHGSVGEVTDVAAIERWIADAGERTGGIDVVVPPGGEHSKPICSVA